MDTSTSTAYFAYDGDGNRVKGTVGGVTTTYIGNYFEWTGNTSTMKRYYYAAGVRVAMRTGTAEPKWLLGDHLGSQSYTVNYAGTSEEGELRYYPWGGTRYTSGATPTTYRYTGQRSEAALGIYYYGARYYDPSLGRFLQADTLVPNPNNPQDWDRYSYVRNNPIIYIDPTGHETILCDEECESNGGRLEKIYDTLLSKANSTTPYGGEEIEALFELMKGDTSAWWYDDGDFTLEEFVGLLIMHEGAGESTFMELVGIVTSQQLYVGGWLGPYCVSGACINGVFNYWAATSQSARGLVDLYVRGSRSIQDYSGFGKEGISDPLGTMHHARAAGKSALHPEKLDPRRYDALSNYGNNVVLVDKLKNTNIKPNLFYPGGNQGIYYYTFDGNGIWFSVNGWKLWMR